MAFIVVSSPSGGGKTTICNMLLKEQSSPISGDALFSISATTREKRQHEVHGREYFFFSKEKFQKMIQDGEFLEYATVCGNLYGTPVAGVSNNKHTLFDIDFQGFRSISKNHFGNNVISIFLLPPSIEALKERLTQRGDVKPDDISTRMQNAIEEILHCQEYDYILTNKNIEDTFEAVSAIVRYELNDEKCHDIERIQNLTHHIKTMNLQNIDTFLENALTWTIEAYKTKKSL